MFDFSQMQTMLKYNFIKKDQSKNLKYFIFENKIDFKMKFFIIAVIALSATQCKYRKNLKTWIVS